MIALVAHMAGASDGEDEEGKGVGESHPPVCTETSQEGGSEQQQLFRVQRQCVPLEAVFRKRSRWRQRRPLLCERERKG